MAIAHLSDLAKLTIQELNEDDPRPNWLKTNRTDAPEETASAGNPYPTSLILSLAFPKREARKAA